MPYEGEQPLSDIELQARGLRPPGPLSPPIDPKTPLANEQAIKDRGQEIIAKGILGTGMGTQSQLIGKDPFNPTALEVLPGALAAGASMLVPGSVKGVQLGNRMIGGPLLRSAVSGLTAGGASKALGGEFTGPAIMGGLTQGTAEIPFMLARQGYNQRTGPLMLEQRAEKEKFNQAMAGAITGAEKAGYEEQVTKLGQQYKDALAAAKTEHATLKQTAEGINQQRMAEYAEKGATHIADEFRKTVPAWKDIESSTKGLLEMAYGKGQERLSASFDKALAEVTKQGRGRNVPIPIDDVALLGIEPTGLVQSSRGMPTHATVDAGELAQALTGRWKKEPALYRRGFAVLDKEGLGNEAARSEYRAGQALISFLDKSKALEGGVFHPDRVANGLTRLKNVDELRRRGMGDVFRGPFAEAVSAQKPELAQVPPMRNVPKPPEIPEPMPTFPPKLPDLGITQRTMGPWERRILGAGAGEAAGLATGHPWAGGVIGGAIGDLAIPRTMYGNVPQGPLRQQINLRGPSVVAEIIRLMQAGEGLDKPGQER